MEQKSKDQAYISVILPAHNPDKHTLQRVIGTLRKQTLPCSVWELFIIDNASNPSIDSWVDLSWHPNARILTEKQLGLTHARFCGINASKGDTIVFVDDDNLLDADYLKHAMEIAHAKPFLGAYGGSIEPEFESQPQDWTRDHWEMIAIRPCTKSVWTNDIDHWEACPSGAGMCLRRDVALKYYQLSKSDPVRSSLGRRGESLVSGEDIDIIFTGLSMGYGMGRFTELQLLHVIPDVRLSESYLLRMYEAKGYSGVLVNALWKREGARMPGQGLKNLVVAGLHALKRELKFLKFRGAQRRGVQKALERIKELKRNGDWRDVPGVGGPCE